MAQQKVMTKFIDARSHILLTYTVILPFITKENKF